MTDRSRQVEVLAILLRELRDAHGVAEATTFVELDAESWMAEYAVRNCQRHLAALTAASQLPKIQLFPIQDGHPGVPWPAALVAYKTYSRQFGTQQSLEMLAKRGGFGLYEFACLYLDVPMRNDMIEQQICKALGKVAAQQSKEPNG